MSKPNEEDLLEADRLVEAAREESAARVRAALGPSPAEREREALQEDLASRPAT